MPTLKQRQFALSSALSAPATAPILLKGDISSNLKAAAGMGYQGLEVHTRETADLNYEDIMNVSSEYGVAISAVVTGRLNTEGQVNLIDDRPYIVDSAMQGMRKYIKMAARLKTNLIVGWVKGNIPQGANPEPYLERLAQNLTSVCVEANEHGVRVFTEVINRYEVNIFTTARETVDFLEKCGIPNCYVHLDTFHMNIEETNPLEAIRICGDRLGYFHAADNTRRFPGTGILDFQAYFKALDEINYSGYISVECLPKPDGKTAAKKAINYLRQF